MVWQTILERKAGRGMTNRAGKSYVRSLLEQGTEAINAKLREEAVASFMAHPMSGSVDSHDAAHPEAIRDGVMTLEELIGRCKAEVSLVVNEHRTYYQKPREWVEDCFERHWRDCPPALADPLPFPDDGPTYNLHFYPDTPIGSYHIVGTSLESVLRVAAECLEGD